MTIQQTISPVHGQLYVERRLMSDAELAATVDRATAAGTRWRSTSLDERIACLERFTDAMLAERDRIAEEITWQMGRPIAHSPFELRGFEERARHMCAIARDCLADHRPAAKPGFERYIKRVPLGVVLVLAPWNYPVLTAVNAVVPALLAGNTVLIKHSDQTPLVAERFADALRAAGLPEGVFQVLYADHEQLGRLLASAPIDFVCFTGSVAGGRAVQRAAAERFSGVALELGGKDPAYVRRDADLGTAITQLVDGAFFNAGQSCCAIERIYVQRDVYRDFVDGFVASTRAYRLGDPTDPETTLGPLVRARAAEFVRGQIAEAVAAGARALVDPKAFPADRPGTPYLAPQVLVDVDHEMRVMREESFGPVVGIMPVTDDDEAVRLMNDSSYGLTASIWTRDLERGAELGDRIETGTVFVNRCDYLDPALAWTGVRDSGRGCTLSRYGFDQLTRPKSYHLRFPNPTE